MHHTIAHLLRPLATLALAVALAGRESLSLGLGIRLGLGEREPQRLGVGARVGKRRDADGERAAPAERGRCAVGERGGERGRK